MKQCPNPNCILYTRLEELPDAYTKCPGCGGQLVDANLLSGALHTGHLTWRPSAGLANRDIDQEFQEAFPQEAVAQAPTGVRAQLPDDEYYPYEQTEQDESVQMQPVGISRSGRIAYVLALLLLLFACALFMVVVGGRFFRSNTVLSADATETAIVALRPAVNTPVAVMPTVAQSELLPPQPSPTPVPPAPAPPTQPPPPTDTSVPLPTQLLPPTQPPEPTQATQPQTVAPTAPPPQSQPTGGVTNAQMVAGLGSGQPSGNVTAYNPNDAFVLAVQAQFGAGGVTTMKVRWYGPDGLLLYEIPRDFSREGTYYTGFTLKKSAPWATGDYRVDIHTNDSPTPAYSVSFSVVP